MKHNTGTQGVITFQVLVSDVLMVADLIPILNSYFEVNPEDDRPFHPSLLCSYRCSSVFATSPTVEPHNDNKPFMNTEGIYWHVFML